MSFPKEEFALGDEQLFPYQFFLSESPVNDKICPFNSELMARHVKKSVSAKMAQTAIVLMVAAIAEENGKEFIVMKVINFTYFVRISSFLSLQTASILP